MPNFPDSSGIAGKERYSLKGHLVGMGKWINFLKVSNLVGFGDFKRSVVWGVVMS